MKPIVIDVHGTPAPQGSKTLVRLPDGRTAMRESSSAVKPWRTTVEDACRDAGHAGLRLPGPLTVRLYFRLPRPKSHYRANGDLRPDAPVWHARTPDVDKLARSTFDALTTAGVITDDAVISQLIASKQYADGSTGARITLTPIEQEQ